jgi:predicted nucleic acid-binding protein
MGVPRPFVVDASVSAAWFLPDEATPVTEAALQATSVVDVWVPALWMLEIGNLLLSAQRRRRISADKRRQLVGAATALRLKLDRDPVDMVVLDEVAAAHGLTTYDAVYLELARRRGLALATCDAGLIRALSKAGVEAAALV